MQVLSKEESEGLLSWGQSDPVDWIRKVLGGDLWGKQREIVESVRDNRYTTVWTCHGPGKTFLGGQIALWFLYCFVPSKVITTAPTHRQVFSLLWSEIRAAHERARRNNPPGLGGKILTTRLELLPQWFAEGFSTREWDPERVQGYHSDHILIIVDEASGVGDPIFDALEGLMASGFARMLMLGNPNNARGRFFEASTSPLYSRHNISAWDTPNFTDLGITRKDIITGAWEKKVPASGFPRPYLITPQWVSERFTTWGKDSPLVKVRIEASFPEDGSSEDQVISTISVLNAQNREFPEDEEHGMIALGVDVARYGNDESIIAARAGRLALGERVLFHKDNMALTGHVIEECEGYGWARVESISVDVIGMGSGPVDRLRELQREGEIPEHVKIIGVNVGSAPTQPGKFVTYRDEIWWRMREIFESGEIGGAISDIALQELSTPKYRISSNGKRQVESKEDLRKADRLGRSPDRADAWILAFVDCKDELGTPSKVRAKSVGKRKKRGR